MSGLAAAQKPAKQKPRQVRQTDSEPAVPTAEQAAGEALLEQMTSRSSAGLVEVVGADGSVSMDLQGRFMSVMVAKTQTDGSVSVACENGPQALHTARTTASSSAAGKRAPAKTPSPSATTVREIK
jgi:hypothetical protein